VDKKIQGRILAAISDLSFSPDEVRGDTVKPLTENMDGLWRYRVGGYRLIYQPNCEKREVYLVGFGPRGSVYD
jgi:mRNA-degrading endonuclease RelE of RelBE toxin-antitoxin system